MKKIEVEIYDWPTGFPKKEAVLDVVPGICFTDHKYNRLWVVTKIINSKKIKVSEVDEKDIEQIHFIKINEMGFGKLNDASRYVWGEEWTLRKNKLWVVKGGEEWRDEGTKFFNCSLRYFKTHNIEPEEYSWEDLNEL